MSEDTVELVRRLFAQAAGFEVDQVETALSDAVLSEFFDPEIEWIPVQQSLLATEPYRGYEGVRRFWTAFLSVWDEYHVEPESIEGAGDRVVAVMRMRGRTHGVEVKEVWSALYAFHEGRIVRVQGFGNRHGAFESAGLPEG